LEENVETEIEKKIAVKINELMKEVDEIITFLKALGEDVGLRLNKLFAQVDNIVVPLTNTVIKMEEAADHLTTFRETSQRALDSMKKFEDASKQVIEGMDAFKVPEFDVLTKQINEVRNESYKALETVKLINEAAAQAVQSGAGTGAPAAAGDVAAMGSGSQRALEAMRSVEELSRRLSDELKASIREASESAVGTIRDVESRTRQVLQEVQGTQEPPSREVQPPTPREAPPVPKGGPPLPPVTERETHPTVTATPPPPPAQAPSRVSAPPSTHIYSSSSEQIFNPIEQALDSTAGALAKAILDARDRIMGMTRKFGAIYDLATTARELARYPQRTLDRREKEVIIEKLASWRSKLSDAMSKS
jgi:ATP-dependent protease HslVU (ClpYQ) peptidase subunit